VPLVKFNLSNASSADLMNRLRLRQLEVFLEVFQRRKITVAAERLAMTQSAVSMTLKQLEETVGATLFDRTTRSLVATPAASDLAAVAERMLRDARAVECMFRVGRVMAGRLAVATTPTFAQTLVPRLVAGFVGQHPGAHVDILDVPPAQFAATLASGQAEVGIGFLGRDDQELKAHRLIGDHLSLVTAKGAVALGASGLPWSALSGYPIALMRPGYGIRQIIDEASRTAGVLLTVSHEVGHMSTALAMAAAGITNTIAPAQLARMSLFPNLEAHRIRAPIVKRDISLVTLHERTLSLLAHRFVEHCLNATARERAGKHA
jgi:LysR family transcriptional regulator, carnitine catabolism transcriptional activator